MDLSCDMTSNNSSTLDCSDCPPAPALNPLSRFSTWSSNNSDADPDEKQDEDDTCFAFDDDFQSPIGSDAGESYSSDDATPLPTPTARHIPQETSTKSLFFVQNDKEMPALLSHDEQHPFQHTRRPNLKRFGQYLGSSSRPVTPEHEVDPFQKEVIGHESVSLLSWKLQALTVATPRLSVTPPTPCNEATPQGQVSDLDLTNKQPQRRPQPEENSGSDRPWRRALYFAESSGHTSMPEGLRILLSSIDD